MNHKENIIKINHIKGVMVKKLEVEEIKEIFKKWEVPIPESIRHFNLKNGEWETIPFNITILKNCCEMAMDEDFIGSNREEIPLKEIIINAYCLMWDIPAPTWSMGMRNPFVIF